MVGEMLSCLQIPGIFEIQSSRRPINHIQAVNIPADSSIESLTTFFSACGTVEVVRIVHKNDPK